MELMVSTGFQSSLKTQTMMVSTGFQSSLKTQIMMVSTGFQSSLKTQIVAFLNAGSSVSKGKKARNVTDFPRG
jgi:hypothetical protein